MSPLARLMVALIGCYRVVISPLIGPSCRFAPTCSGYAIEAIRSHGALRGGVLAGRRLLRCHPLNDGGWDPVPQVCEHVPGVSATDAEGPCGP